MEIYSSKMALATDLYQITMAYGYWKSGKSEDKAVFHLFYRKNPFKNNYVIACGLADVITYVQNWQFQADDIAYLAELKGNDGQLLFEKDFLDYLAQLRFTGNMFAVEEGTAVFPFQPLIRIEAPIVQAQLLETALLTMMNFQSLIATKASRVVRAAQGDTVLEFGLRRAQGLDGGISAARAAYIGGCHGTSNVIAGKVYDIPVKGTHAHSWVMAFPSEMESFEAYAAVMPNNCIFLVDTYDTIEGVKNAIKVGKELQAKGHIWQGIRLDSGDLAALSIAARKLLDEAGFEQVKIVASDDLSEYRITELKARGAKIDTWAVGTQLVTAYDQPALGGVYKLAAMYDDNTGKWQYKMKFSDTPIKVSNPGLLQIRRFFMSDGKPFGDMIWNEEFSQPHTSEIAAFDGRHIVAKDRAYEDLLKPIFVKGCMVFESKNIHEIRQYAMTQCQVYNTVNFELYPLGLESELNALKMQMIAENEAKNKLKA